MVANSTPVTLDHILYEAIKCDILHTDQLPLQMKKLLVLPLLLLASITYCQTLDETLVWLNEEFAINSDNAAGIEIEYISGTATIKMAGDWHRFKVEDVIQISVREKYDLKSVAIYTMPRKVESWAMAPWEKDLSNKKELPYLSSSVFIVLEDNHNAITKGLIHLLKLEGNELKPRKALFKN